MCCVYQAEIQLSEFQCRPDVCCVYQVEIHSLVSSNAGLVCAVCTRLKYTAQPVTLLVAMSDLQS